MLRCEVKRFRANSSQPARFTQSRSTIAGPILRHGETSGRLSPQIHPAREPGCGVVVRMLWRLSQTEVSSKSTESLVFALQNLRTPLASPGITHLAGRFCSATPALFPSPRVERQSRRSSSQTLSSIQRPACCEVDTHDGRRNRFQNSRYEGGNAFKSMFTARDGTQICIRSRPSARKPQRNGKDGIT